jgi:hypothetical protein
MKTDNERLKVILHDAKLICMSKLQMVQGKFGATHPHVDDINKKMNKAISVFDNPVLWMRPIPFEENDMTNFVVKIDLCDPADLTLFVTEMGNFIKYLEIKVLKDPLANMEASDISDFNLKVLDALLQNQRNIGGRKVFFKNQGIDVDNHPQFIPLRDEQEPILVEYRRVLNKNEVQSTESDVSIFKMIGNAIQQATELTKFFDIYKMFTTAMKRKLPNGSVPIV